MTTKCVPLCYPDNFKWDKHEGIWMSTEVFKKTLENGEEVTVVVLDTEGLGAYDANNQDDVHLFTLICLLSSVLVYNCRGTMTSEDITKLGLVGTLDKVIRGKEVRVTDESQAKDFRKFFPNFLWVIRDVTLACALPRGSKLVEVGMHEYVLKEVLNSEDADCERDNIKERNRLRTVLLTSFPAFYSMKLPLPATKPSVMAVMDRGATRNRLSQTFLDGVDEFVSRCGSLMKPKKAWPYIGNITGCHFAGLIRQYVYELAVDGTEICMQTVGKRVMEETLDEMEQNAFVEYCNNMGKFAQSALPCPDHEIFKKHNDYFFKAMKNFKKNSKYINDVDLLNQYRKNFEERICIFAKDHHVIIAGYLKGIFEDNVQKSDAFCKQLAMDLVKQKLDPLISSSAGSGSPVDLNTEIQLVEKLYKEQARGPQVLHVYKTVVLVSLIK
ncbi:guanylate-binding protein 3-like [Ptychodera flava]|uniref:guanylate-binding protein 3-like n=1 Tax=Ptychodera flava TaxID=63121 RepID=UPI00396A1570